MCPGVSDPFWDLLPKSYAFGSSNSISNSFGPQNGSPQRPGLFVFAVNLQVWGTKVPGPNFMLKRGWDLNFWC
jgi:hypothetical protein